MTGAYWSFHGMKQLGVLLLLPGWDASPSQGLHPSISSGFPDNLLIPFIPLIGERHCKSYRAVPHFKTKKRHF